MYHLPERVLVVGEYIQLEECQKMDQPVDHLDYSLEVGYRMGY
jgi:hypothetical protein